METYTVTLSKQDFSLIGAALMELPYKHSAGVISELDRQILEQASRCSAGVAAQTDDD